MDTPRLHGTPLSHLTRKVPVVVAELGVGYEFVRGPGVLAPTTAAYGDNPLMRVPTLLHGAHMLIESDHIARYLAASTTRQIAWACAASASRPSTASRSSTGS